MDLETRDWLRRRHAAELAEYWGPKARGVEVAAQAGWYFTGREAALAELSGWLADPAADIQLRVLTGDPGSGKSAVLGRLVTLADTSAARPAHPILAPGRLAAASLRRCWQGARQLTSCSLSSQQVSASLPAQNSQTRSACARYSRW